MPLLREGDRCLVDEACWEDKEMVRIGCMATEMWRCSEVMNLAGSDICRALCSNGPAEKAASRKWCAWVRTKVTGIVGEGGLQRRGGGWAQQLELGAWMKESVWCWQLVSWIGGDGDIQVGRKLTKVWDTSTERSQLTAVQDTETTHNMVPVFSAFAGVDNLGHLADALFF